MNKTFLILIAPLLFCILGCNDGGISYTNTDLSYFNLSGKVRQFSNITVSGTSDNAETYETMAPNAGPYYRYNFSKEGLLKKVEIINPAFYSPADARIDISRTGNSLVISENSIKAKSRITYSKTGDTLSYAHYVNIADNELDYYHESYKKYVSLKSDGDYTQHGYLEGKSEDQITMRQNYAVVKNQKGLDSLIYIKLAGENSNLIYTVNYLSFDKKGNWLVGQFIRNDRGNSYTIYRSIQYFE